uniref:G-protein coupled receptors family 1 profile domain-containing protein n=1 Tax=Myripristis murdjan TaxID=586833 RepID=A0A667ZC94_9TELE
MVKEQTELLTIVGDNTSALLLQSTAAKVCILCILLPIPIFAILGNLFIMAAVVRIQKLRTSTNAFVVSLAMADFLVAVLVMPFSLVRSVDPWHFGRPFCQAHFVLDVSLCTSSIFNLSCVALDRNIAVCNPLCYPVQMSPRRVAILLLLCWILPLLISSLCVSFGMDSQSPPAELYSPIQQENQTCLAAFHVPYALASSTLCFFIPVGFMLFAYGKIFLAAQRQARWIHAMEHQAGQLQMSHSPMRADLRRQAQACVESCSLKKERKTAKTLGLIMGVFLFCWLPFLSVNVAHPLWGYSNSPVVLEAFMWLGCANSSLNPFLYASFKKSYRHAFVAILDCGGLGRKLRAWLESSHRCYRGDRVKECTFGCHGNCCSPCTSPE